MLVIVRSRSHPAARVTFSLGGRRFINLYLRRLPFIPGPSSVLLINRTLPSRRHERIVELEKVENMDTLSPWDWLCANTLEIQSF
jgi:hypothetical protein